VAGDLASKSIPVAALVQENVAVASELAIKGEAAAVEPADVQATHESPAVESAFLAKFALHLPSGMTTFPFAA